MPPSLRLLLVGVLAVGACGGSDEGPSQPPKRPAPNVLLYIVDTLRADSLACYGNETVETPAVDRLAREGTLFENAIAPSPWTRPSVASLLTGLSPAVHGAQGRGDKLSEAIELLPEIFQQAGYHTAFINTNPNAGAFFGFEQGFDDFVELYRQRAQVRKRVNVGQGELITRSDEVTERAIQWIDSARRPFFLTVLTVDPHGPYQPPARFDRYGSHIDSRARGAMRWLRRKNLSSADKERIRSLYYGEIAFNDDSLGGLLDHLDESDNADETIVVFTSDHGEEFWEHGRFGHNKTLFEESIHVPLVLRYPGVVAAGERVARPVETLQVAHTLLRLTGLEPSQGSRGLLESSPADEAIYSRLRNEGRDLFSVRAFPWKLIVDLASGSRSLFNLLDAPGEDAVAENAVQLRRLERLLAEQLRSDAERFEEIHLGASQAPAAGEDVPEDVLDSLKALGYVN